MKKGIAIVATLGFAAGVAAYFMIKRIKTELELGLNMEPEDLDDSAVHEGHECECNGECACGCECHCAAETPDTPTSAEENLP